MLKLLLVGDGRQIFFVEYVKALKKIMDVEVTVYCPFPKNDWYKELPYDYSYFDDYQKCKFSKIKGIGFLSWPFMFRHRFGIFLKSQGKKYDIIHFKWLLPSWTLGTNLFRKYGEKIIVSFWGGELESQKILYSNRLYLRNLNNLFNVADFGIGTTAIYNPVVYERYPQLAGKCHYGMYGSSIIDQIVNKQKNRINSKQRFNIPTDKITIMPGYSGKPIHYHCELLELISKHPSFNKIKKNIHIICPMTRGGMPDYINRIEQRLSHYELSHTVITDYLDDEQIADLRLATDILLQVSHHDEISTSVLESLSAGVLMIAGDWFPNYSLLNEYGFRWLPVSNIEECVDSLYCILKNIESYEEIRSQNRQVGLNKFTWTNCIIEWAELYKKAQNMPN